jgi:type I restriction enzyme S subunit
MSSEVSDATHPLGELVEILSGFPFKSEAFSSDPGEGTPLIRIRDIKTHRPSCNFVGEYDAAYLIHDGDIIIGMDGEFTAVRWKGVPALLNQRVLKIRSSRPDLIDDGYLFHRIQSDLAHLETVISGTTVKHLSVKDIRRLEWRLPPLDEQRRIAEVLRSVDEVAVSVADIIAQGERAKQAVLRRLLSRGLRPTDLSTSSLGDIPTDWEVSRIGDLAKVIRGASPRPKGDPRYYGGTIPRLMVADVTRDGMYTTPQIDFLTEEGAGLSRPVRAGTLTIVCSGTVGIPSFLAVDACIHDGFLALQNISSDVDPTYLYYLLSTMRDRFEKNATHGGVFTNLTTDILKDFEVSLPAHSEQRAMIEIFLSVDESLNASKRELKSVIEVKRNLSALLLNGEFNRASIMDDTIK